MFAPFLSYLRFIRGHKSLLTFGLLMTFGSSFGQSFFVGLYQMPLREMYGLSASAFGGAFSFVTLLSAAALPWTGRVIDQVKLRTFSTTVILVLSGAALAIALVPSFWMFVVALFFLRHFGQGLMSHTSSTAMGRYFSVNRGKAVTISAAGYSFGEAIFPAIAVALIALVGWRESWAIYAAVLLLVLLPLTYGLVRTDPTPETVANSDDATGPVDRTAKRDWTRAEVMRDPRFYILIPAMMAPAFILTGFFVHQGYLAQSKGWPIELVAAGFSVFAIVKLVASLLAGPFADRFGFRPLIALYMVPLAFSMIALGTVDATYGIFLYFTLAGISTGGAMAVGGLLWPELYGTKHLGAIRSLSVSLMVFATALAPVTFGWLIDAGLGANMIAHISLSYSVVAVALVIFFLMREKSQNQAAA